MNGDDACRAQAALAPEPMPHLPPDGPRPHAVAQTHSELQENLAHLGSVPAGDRSAERVAETAERRHVASGESGNVGGCAEVQTVRLPAKPDERKAIPICTGVLDYFPDALAAVAMCSKVGNDQHNPGEKLRWAREKSSDHADCLLRHLVDRGKVDSDGVPHMAKACWRALALLQLEIEAAK